MERRYDFYKDWSIDAMVKFLIKLFKRKKVFKEARVGQDGEFVTVEYAGYANKSLNLHLVKHEGSIFIIHGGQIR